MAVAAAPIPPAVWDRIRRFLADGNTGQVILDVKDGRVLAYKLTECGRVDDKSATRIREPVVE